MSNYYSIITNAGIQKEILSKQNGSSINLAKMAVGSGEITPIQTMTSLKNEKYRFNINSILQSETNPNHLIVEGVIPSNVGGFEISEIGIYLDDNTFYAVGNLPKTYKPLLDEGSAKDLTIKMFIEVSNSDSIVLKVDDSVVLATRNFVQNELKKYAFLNGDELQNFRVKDAINSFDAVNSRTLNYALKKLIPAGIMSIWTGTIAPDGYLIANGAVLNRSAYKDLWAFAEKSGNIVTETEWLNGRYGSYSIGDNATTFRIPDIRNHFIRGLNTTRVIGNFQKDSIKQHNHFLPTSGSRTSDIETLYGIMDSYWGNTFVNQNPTNSSSAVTFTTGNIEGLVDETRPVNIALNYIIKY
ncbi:phage tail-collar fiber domain-containing protein [Aliarcobacter butzleri]|uniref:phage tail-collar fiber domain-containing protein n=1 Tax=Aliarcobacter butzleri TaxID=28197 RepID=UPI0018675C5C|nr:phage tail protein [Aliarcobacter butzleri]